MIVLLLLGAVAANFSISNLGAFERVVEYLADDGIIQSRPCELVQQQGDVCFIAPLTTASQFSQLLDDTLEVFHGLGLYRSDWISNNGVWSLRIFHPLEQQALEIYITERNQQGAPFLEGLFFLR